MSCRGRSVLSPSNSVSDRAAIIDRGMSPEDAHYAVLRKFGKAVLQPLARRGRVNRCRGRTGFRCWPRLQLARFRRGEPCM